MPTRQLDHLCWVLEYPRDAPEDYRHFPTEAEARETVEDKYAETVSAWQFAAPCHVAVCDSPGCGEVLENESEGWTIHEANPADLGNAAARNGWTVTDAGVFACYEDSTAGRCGHEFAVGDVAYACQRARH